MKCEGITSAAGRWREGDSLENNRSVVILIL